MRDIGLYIHIPFCKKKCYYCGFTSYAGKTHMIERYIDCVILECQKRVEQYGAMSASTLYLGGGTPSLLNQKQLQRLVLGIGELIPLGRAEEFTLEANPCDVTDEMAAFYGSIGIDRISLGMQSLNPRLLKSIGRTHTVENFFDAVLNLHKYGIDNISADVMFALPSQSPADVEDTLKGAVLAGVKHISSYGLMIEEGTAFERLLKKGSLVLPKESEEMEMWHVIDDVLERSGFCRYEISSYGLPGYRGRHNMKYWKLSEYLGLGAGAHSYLHPPIRFSNTADLNQYLSGNFESSPPERISHRGTLEEYIMLGTRLSHGIDKGDFIGRFGVEPWERMMPVVKKLNKFALFTKNGFALNKSGMAVQNSVVLELLKTV